MASELDISLNIRNNTNYPQEINIMGNPANLLDTSNATTEYRWNFTTFVFTIENAISVQYKLNGAAVFSVFTFGLPSKTLQGVQDALNQLGIGYFNSYTELGQKYIGTYNDNYTFGQINIFNNTGLATPIILYDFTQTAFYANGDASVADLSGNGNAGIPVVGTGNGVPTTLNALQLNYQTVPFGNLSFPSSTTQQFSIRLPNVSKFAGTLPYTLMSWFSDTDTAWLPANQQQGIISAEGRNGGSPIGYNFYISNNAGYFISQERFNLSTGVKAQIKLTFGVEIAPAFVPNAYYFAMAGFDGTEMYLSVYATNGVRYDVTLPTTFSLDTNPAWGAFVGLRYANWLNGNMGYTAIYDTWTGYGIFDTIYNATKSIYGY
jgi:hypothetical protein